MSVRFPSLLLALCLASCIVSAAQAAPASIDAKPADAKPAEVKPPPVKPGWTVLVDEPGEPEVREVVLEDDHTRIEELRVRGQTKRATVQPKNPKAPAYEIVYGDASQDLSAGTGSTRGAIGKRVWRVLDF